MNRLYGWNMRRCHASSPSQSYCGTILPPLLSLIQRATCFWTCVAQLSCGSLSEDSDDESDDGAADDHDDSDDDSDDDDDESLSESVDAMAARIICCCGLAPNAIRLGCRIRLGWIPAIVAGQNLG